MDLSSKSRYLVKYASCFIARKIAFVLFVAMNSSAYAEVAVHILRLALSGALDRHPRLKLLIGHMGECLPTMMDQVERVFRSYSRTHLDRNAARAIVEQVWVSTSGFSSKPAFPAAFMTFGADRLLFSADYPFGNNVAAVDFLKQLPVSPENRQKIAHQNADALLRLSSAL
jgi:uncharacterized protein